MSNCVYCEEPMLPTDRQEAVRLITAQGIQQRVAHWACAARQAVGSVAHQAGRCSCYVPGSQESDPPGMTPRQAAEAAVALFQQQHDSPPSRSILRRLRLQREDAL